MKKYLVIIAVFGLFHYDLFAAGVRVGNGDTGHDLEKLAPVTSGILLETQQLAIKKVQDLNTKSVPYLGQLEKEIKNSKILLVENSMSIKKGLDKGYETSNDGKDVYARTFAEPNADTRFFPKALTLNSNQLIALHIHEALHRSLPEHVREDEVVVSKITLAIVSPDTTFDRIAQMTNSLIESPPRDKNNNMASKMNGHFNMYQAKDLERASLFSLGYRTFDNRSEINKFSGVYSIKSFLYPFGEGSEAIGMGIELNYITKKTAEGFLGPVKVSGRKQFLTYRGFNISVWGELGIIWIGDRTSTSGMSRPHTVVGLTMTKLSEHFYVENFINVNLGSQVKEAINKVEYEYDFKNVYEIKIRGGLRSKSFDYGVLSSLIQSNGYEVSGGNFNQQFDGQNVIRVGAELAYKIGNLQFGLEYLTNISKEDAIDAEFYSDLSRIGVGSQQVATSLSYIF